MRTTRILTSTAALLTAALLAAAAAVTACARSASPAARPAGPQLTRADTVPAVAVSLRVESHNSSDIVIYAGRGRMHQRLGTVTGSTTRALSIPGRFASDPGGFYLVAHRVGGGTGTDLTSPTIYVQSGQTVVWTIESVLAHSSLAIE